MSSYERKVITVLFADLASFTSRAEQLDPEDVQAMLKPYHARLRYELERWGGIVEKFIGDAVVAFLGAPGLLFVPTQTRPSAGTARPTPLAFAQTSQVPR